MAVCRSCAAALPEGARFCPACGTPVSGGTGEERKIVTVLFADLVASTAKGDQRDPEDVRAAVRPQLLRIREELERHGGTFEKYVGDAVMAVFGAPLAHEDDPERAVRAAIAIRDAIRGVRVAVNTGEAVVALDATPGSAEGIATGDVVTTAFRIEEAAGDDIVLVGEPTYRATHGAIEYGERRVLQAKGKSEPVVVYEALRTLTDLHPSFPVTPPLAPLVGRQRELDLILDTLARVRRDRTVHLVTLIGVPGIGKSRLVWELQRAVEDEPGLVLWRRGRCLPYGDGVTYWALGEMVKAQAGILETDDAGTATVKLNRAVGDLVTDPSEAIRVETHLRPLLALEAAVPGAVREDAFASWRRFFEALAEWGPLVLTFEDLHWADEELLDFIEYLADWGTGMPLVLLCTARPGLHERRSGWGGRPNAATILLPPLSPDETGALVGLLLRQTLVPAELQDVLLRRSEGNPLYAEEFVRMLVERGLLYRDGGGWQLRSGELPVPESVQGIIAARLDTLGPEEKNVLRDAAVIGRGFWPGAISAVSAVSREDVESVLHALERKELVRRLGASAVGGELQYSFHHALVRDVAYGLIPRAERALKHRLAAEWIDALGRTEDHAETIAHHYLQALDYARASGQATDEFAEHAREALARAGDRASALNAFQPAERYYQEAIALGDEDDPLLLFKLGRARCNARGEGLDLLDSALDGLVAIGERGAAAEAQVLIARTLVMQGKKDQAASRFDAAAALAEGQEPSRSKAFVLANLAAFLMASDRGREAVVVGRETLEMAEQLGLDDLCAHARATIGTARVATGDAGGVEDLQESVRIAREANSPELVRAELNLGSVLANLGRLEEAFEAHAHGRDAAERLGDPGRLRWFQAEHAYELYWRGRSDDALALTEEIIALVAEGSPHVAEHDAHLIRGWIRLDDGDVQGALADADRALELGRAFGEPQLLFPGLAFHARAALAAGDIDAADSNASELLEAWAALRAVTFPSFWVGELALALRDLGRADELLPLADKAGIRTRWLEAAAAVCRGDLERATELYAEMGSVADAARVTQTRRTQAESAPPP